MRYIGSTVVALGLLALPLSAGAQEKRPPGAAERPAQERPARDAMPQKVTADAVNVNELRDARVVDKRGEELGSVRELRVHPQEGRITHAEIGVGGVLAPASFPKFAAGFIGPPYGGGFFSWWLWLAWWSPLWP
jgi:hypothetical protein